MSVNDAQQYHQNMVHFLRAQVVFGDSGSAVSLGWLPADATVLRGGVVVTTAFNAGTSNVCDLGFRNAGDGTANDDDEFATDLALGTEGVIVADEMATAGDAHFAEGAEVIATPALSGTAATAGAGYAWVEYIVDNE